MENQTTSPKQIMLNYGLMLGFIGILISVVNYAMGNSYNMSINIIIGILLIIVSIVFIVLSLKKIKNFNNGFLSLSEALKTGLGVILISSLLSISYNYVFSNYIEPDYEKNVLLATEQWTIDNFSIPDEAADKLHEETLTQIDELQPGSFKPVVKGLGASLLFGLIISLIVGLIMRKTEEVD